MFLTVLNLKRAVDLNNFDILNLSVQLKQQHSCINHFNHFQMLTSCLMLAFVAHAPSPHEVIVSVFVHCDVIMTRIGVLVAFALLAVVHILVIVHAERLVVVQRLALFTL